MITLERPAAVAQATDLYTFAALTDMCEKARDTNEDRFLHHATSGGLILALADGMGGLENGEMAAEAAIQGVYLEVGAALTAESRSQESINDAFRMAVQSASTVIRTKCPGGGTTLTAMALMDGRAIIAHVGDTRAYLMREGNLIALTRDDNEFEASRGECAYGHPSPETLADYESLSCLTAFIGRQASPPRLTSIQLEERDWLLLTSDGVHDRLTDQEMARILKGCASPQEGAKKLLNAARKNQLTDNATLVVAAKTSTLPPSTAPWKGWMESGVDLVQKKAVAQGLFVLACVLILGVWATVRPTQVASKVKPVVPASSPRLGLVAENPKAGTSTTPEAMPTDPEAIQAAAVRAAAAKAEQAAIRAEEKERAEKEKEEEERTRRHHSTQNAEIQSNVKVQTPPKPPVEKPETAVGAAWMERHTTPKKGAVTHKATAKKATKRKRSKRTGNQTAKGHRKQ